MRLQEAVVYEDLEAAEKIDVNHLNLARLERYMNGPTAVVQSTGTCNFWFYFYLEDVHKKFRLGR